jgi:hypothetical protein
MTKPAAAAIAATLSPQMITSGELREAQYKSPM